MAAAELFKIGIDKAVNVAVHNSLDISGFKAGAVILNKGVGHENIGANLTAPCNFFVVTFNIFNLCKVLTLFNLNKL